MTATIGLVILYVGGAVALGTPPDADDKGDAVVAWFRDNDSHVRWWVWFGVLTAIAFATFASLVRSRLPSPHRDVFFFGAIALAVETTLQSWIWAGLSWHPDQLDPATARTMLDVASFWGPVLTSTTILMLAPVALLALRGEARLPTWLGVLTGVTVAEQLVETITVFGDKGFTAPGGPMNLFLGAGLVVVSFVSLGVVSARTLDAEVA